MEIMSPLISDTPFQSINKLEECRLIETDVEIYLARALGLSLSVLGVIVLFFTGTIPLSSSMAGSIASLDDTTDPKAPYARPILLVTTLFQGFTAVYCYMRYVNVSQTGFLLGCAGYGALACMGMVSLSDSISKNGLCVKRFLGAKYYSSSVENSGV